MPDEVRTQWNGYSDYQSVSQRNAQAIHDAVEGFAIIQQAHSQGVKVQSEDAADAGARIMTAAITVQTELHAYADDNERYQDLLDSFEGREGYTARLKSADLSQSCPAWLYQCVVDIRRAGFQLGYLKAGRESDDRDLETDEDEARQMFANI